MYSQPFSWNIQNDIWFDKGQEFTYHHYVKCHLGKSDNRNICASLAMLTCNIWCNSCCPALVGASDIITSISSINYLLKNMLQFYLPFKINKLINTKHRLCNVLFLDDVLERMMDDQTAEDCKLLSGHSGPVYSGSFSPDKHYLTSCSEDGTGWYHCLVLCFYFSGTLGS